jgi:hypothetical protein
MPAGTVVLERLWIQTHKMALLVQWPYRLPVLSRMFSLELTPRQIWRQNRGCLRLCADDSVGVDVASHPGLKTSFTFRL